MTAKREPRPSRKMKQVFLVFCEGETKENYLNLVRKEFRSPIKIVSKIEGAKISQKLIDKRKNELKIAAKENILAFLMYDLDKTDMLERLNSCQAVKLFSNPCIELWFLLHAQEQTSTISTQNCLKMLQKSDRIWENFEKPFFSLKQQQFLLSNIDVAIKRAKQLDAEKNPSTTVYKLFEFIKQHNK